MVLVPYAVQASHALDNHEHVVCTAKDVKHFHAEELDCNLCCRSVELNTLLFNYPDNSIDPIKYLNSFNTISQLSSLELFTLKSPRAPPIIS